MLLENLILFTVTCAILVVSSNKLVRALSKISYYFGLNEFTIGFILVAIATSLPETFVGIMSAINGIPELTIGNVIGSNILDLTLVIGVTTLLARQINIDSKIVKKDLFLMVIIVILPVLLMMDHLLWAKLGVLEFMVQGLSRFDGIILLGVFAWYIKKLVSQEHQFSKHTGYTSKQELFAQVGIFITAVAGLLISAHYVVVFAQSLALDLSLSPLMIGLFLISFGTSVPELAFETRAVLTNHSSMAVGDLVGSVIANSTLVLGITALIHPIQVNMLVYMTSTMFMIFTTFIFFTFADTTSKLTWKEGVSLLMLYILFLTVETYIKAISVQ